MFQVEYTDELKRILNLRRKEADDAAQPDLSYLVNRNEKCECLTTFRRKCCSELLPTQKLAIATMERERSLFGAIGCGHGKTLLNLLSPFILRSKRALLLLPASAKEQFLNHDTPFYAQHWKVPNLTDSRWHYPGRPFMTVLSYSEISSMKGRTRIADFAPDLIILDEMHNLSSFKSVRTRRWLAYIQQHKPKVVGWSGTAMKKELTDWAHLIHSMLLDQAPVPRTRGEQKLWAMALSPKDDSVGEGELTRFGSPAVEAYGKFVRNTPGVVSSGNVETCDASLTIRERTMPDFPSKYQELWKKLEAEWERPDGEYLDNPLAVRRAKMQLACGFYLRWNWPKNTDPILKDQWLKARAAYHKEVRAALVRPNPEYDSPGLLWQAAKSGTWKSQHFAAWADVKTKLDKPPTEAVWLDDTMVRDVVAWLDEGPGIAWSCHPEFCSQVAKRRKDTVWLNAGDEASVVAARLKGTERVIASVAAHSESKNLQMFWRNLFTTPESDPKTWEQQLSRTFRTGQLSDEVIVDVYLHTELFRNNVADAQQQAAVVQTVLGNNQKLVSLARWDI